MVMTCDVETWNGKNEWMHGFKGVTIRHTHSYIATRVTLSISSQPTISTISKKQETTMLDYLLKNLKHCKKNPNHAYFTNKGCGLCVAEDRLKANLKTIQEKKAEPRKIRGFEIKKLSRESMEHDKWVRMQSEKRAMRVTYFIVMLYSLLMTSLPRIALEYKTTLDELGISLQLVGCIIGFNLLHWLVKKGRKFLVRHIGGTTVNALITYTYCCVITALVVGNDIDWAKLFKAF